MEPSILVDHLIVETTHDNDFLSLQLFHLVFGETAVVRRFSQSLDIFFHKSIDDTVIYIFRDIKQFAYTFLIMLDKCFIDNFLVGGIKSLFKQVVGLIILICFCSVFNYDYDSKSYHHYHRHYAAVVEQQCYHEAYQERHYRCYEPSADDGEHSSDAVYSTLSRPGAVSQRSAHSHHKCNVSR